MKMVTGWRRAFCTSIPKDRETKILSEKQRQQHCEISNVVVQSPKFSSKFGFFSNPSTPRLQSQHISSPSLQCRTTNNTTTTPTPTSSVPNSPRLQCKTETTPKKNSSPRLFQFSNPLSPKSPSSFSLLKASLRLSKVRSFLSPLLPYCLIPFPINPTLPNHEFSFILITLRDIFPFIFYCRVDAESVHTA